MAVKKTDSTTKEGKFVIDKASGKIITAGAEEIDATQPLLEILINEAGWKADQIVSRPQQWRVPASPSNKRVWPVDVAIFADSTKTRDSDHVLILCECKRPDVETGLGQLKIYLDREPHARVGIWFNGIDYKILYKTVSGYEEAPDGTPIPTPDDPLAPLGKRVLAIADLRKPPSLVPVFRRVRDRLATLDRNVNRDEEILPDISLLLLLKIRDEQDHKFKPKSPLTFQIDDDTKKTAARIKAFLEGEVRKNAALFGAEGREIRFQIDDDSIYYVVETLQNYQLLTNNDDAVAQAFQVIRGKAYKGEEGQYFTPPSVVRVAIAAVDPSPQDRVIDPACGSGSFLATALHNVVSQLVTQYGPNSSDLMLAKREWSTRELYAIDKDSVSVRLSKAYLSMLGDGSTHVIKTDAIRPSKWSLSDTAVIKDGTFDVVVTNPPFGTKLKVPAAIGRQERYDLSRAWKRTNSGRWQPTDDFEERDLGLLFLERSMRLLQKGGRLAIVLPDTYLFSDSYGWLIEWLSQFTITHSINVPIEAFEPHCRAKTSILVIKKASPPKSHRVIGSVCETYGEDKHGRARYNFIDGAETTTVDDEMSDAGTLFRNGRSRADSKLFLHFSQSDAIKRGVLVASYWWRKPYLDALDAFAKRYDCDLVSIGELMDSGDLNVFEGHGSPKSHFKGRGTVPYIKVVDIKNWRMVENPSYFMPQAVADQYTAKRPLKPYDLITPTRASKNIGLFAVVMPWQTNSILTREIFVWRINERSKHIDRWLFLALASLRVVHDQFKFLVLMQMNREDLGERYRELLLPIPRKASHRQRWANPIRTYFEAVAAARSSYSDLHNELDPSLFADRP